MKPFPLFLLPLLLPCLCAADCPDDWFDTENPDLGCFFFGDKPKTWVEAHEECEESIGHMAEATTLEQANAIYDLAKIIGDFRGVKRLWLGLTDIIKEGDWHWANSYDSGSVQTSDFEKIWTPNDAAGNLDDCVIMKVDSTLSWADIRCDLNKTTIEADASEEDIHVLCQCVGDEECFPPTPEPTPPTPPPLTCDAGWFANQGLGCIKPLPESVAAADTATREKAATACTKVDGGSTDGFLVEPQNACKEAALEDFLKYTLSRDLWWINLKYDTDQWKWDSQEPYDEKEADWGPGSPGPYPKYIDCVAIEKKDGVRQWYNRPCSEALTESMRGGGICVKDPKYECVETGSSSSTSSTPEGETTTTTPTPGTDTTTEPRGCQHNPSEANGPCYLVKDDAKSFQEAEDYCVSLGGNLASSLSLSENIYIGGLVSAASRPYWWIGAQCADGTACTSDDRWAWTDGSTWTYENWVTDNGSNGCAFYERSSRKWRSWSCTSTFPFVCKI